MSQFLDDTICAISTPRGVGGIAVVRVSGPDAIQIADSVWGGLSLAKAKSHTAHFGDIIDSDGSKLDEAVATVFRAPRSFTGEDTVELSVHGSVWVQRRLVMLLVERGARVAEAGEFTRRAFASGRLDLAQAEAVADIIAASSRSAHRVAMSQMRGDFSGRLASLREQLLELSSLLELELDFSEEDVEFASRTLLLDIATAIQRDTTRLADSFSAGRAIKEGIPVAIVGATNAGKSTLLNRLLGEERAIVSDIHGTTRDVIEDTIDIDGTLFRFIDTAGLRDTSDSIETMGIERTIAKLSQASIVIWVVDGTASPDDCRRAWQRIRPHLLPTQRLIPLINKADIAPDSDAIARTVATIIADEFPSSYYDETNSQADAMPHTTASSAVDAVDDAGTLSIPDVTTADIATAASTMPSTEISSAADIAADAGSISSSSTPSSDIVADAGNTSTTPPTEADIAPESSGIIRISARQGDITTLHDAILKASGIADISNEDILVTNERHYQSLLRASRSITRAIDALHANLPGDLIAQDIRETLHHLGEITGTITTHEILGTIFSRFCVGK